MAGNKQKLINAFDSDDLMEVLREIFTLMLNSEKAERSP
jgi:hypothetical protein